MIKPIDDQLAWQDVLQEKKVFIPRIPLIPTDLPFNFNRLQFPIRVCFCTHNKQSSRPKRSIQQVSDLRVPCSSRGQLYVAFSRASWLTMTCTPFCPERFHPKCCLQWGLESNKFVFVSLRLPYSDYYFFVSFVYSCW